MSAFSNSSALHHSLSILLETWVIPRAAKALADSRQETAHAFREAVLAEVPAFSASANPDILPGLGEHADEHMREIERLLGGEDVGSFGFVKVHAELRAEQRFPLEAVLHAHRCGHRIFARWLRDAAVAARPKSLEGAVSAVADFALEYTNAVSTIAASEYVAHTRRLADVEVDLRTELLNTLLSGYDESDGRAARLLRRAGYLEQRHSYCVAAVQSANAAEMEHPARAQRIITAISEALAGTSIRMLAGIRNNLAIAVLSDRRRQSGWTAPQAALAERVHPLLLTLGPAVLAGISADHPSTAFVPKALHEASIALDFAGVSKRVVAFAGLPIRALLVHRGAESVQSALPGWVGAFAAADAKMAGALVQTLRAIADADMNVQKAARVLGKHANTVYARIERIKDMTGLDGQRYHDLTELLLAADCRPG
jgi:PucR C-terminal helix-turn-helix domain/GGDEF-like domain